MESLIIFLLFIAFSVIKSLGGESQRAPRRYPGMPQGRPAGPGRPARPVPPLYRPDAVPPEYADLLYKTRPEEGHETAGPVKAGKEDAAPQQQRRADTLFLEPEDDFLFDLDGQTLLQSIVFAEVLGPPKAKKPWQYK